MKLLNLAIASIVDANTGNGINRQYIEQFGSNYSSYQQLGREIRAKSVLGVVARIKNAVKQYVENSKTTAQNRKSIKEISQMSARMLRDIGLTRNDVDDLRLGLISLDTLNTRRLENLSEQEPRLNQTGQSTKGASVSVVDADSANDEAYELEKCA